MGMQGIKACAWLMLMWIAALSTEVLRHRSVNVCNRHGFLIGNSDLSPLTYREYTIHATVKICGLNLQLFKESLKPYLLANRNNN
ncbi:MAG: hypothetical protein ACKPKO_01615, partial [Candidatus Fonsibacter sp.]